MQGGPPCTGVGILQEEVLPLVKTGLRLGEPYVGFPGAGMTTDWTE